MEILHEIIFTLTELAVLMFELLALVLLLYQGLKGLFALYRHDKTVSLGLLKGFSEGLTFLLGAEILKTIILTNVSGLFMVAGVTAVRIALSILIHWEMHLEEKEKELEHTSQKIEFANQLLTKASERHELREKAMLNQEHEAEVKVGAAGTD